MINIKNNVFLCIGLLLAAGCTSEVWEDGMMPQNPKQFEAAIEKSSYHEIVDTRAVFDSEGKNIIWSDGDKIGVGLSDGTIVPYELSKGVGQKTAVFVGSLPQGATLSGKAVYPYNKETSISGNTLTLTMPAEYYYKADASELGDYAISAGMPMYAEISSSALMFTHLGGYFVFEIDKIPVGSTKFEFVAEEKKITGSFSVDLSGLTPTYTTEADKFELNNKVTIYFQPTTSVCKKIFYVPVPLGSYDFSWRIYKDDEKVAFGTNTQTVEVERGGLYRLRRECSNLSTGEGSTQQYVNFPDPVFSAYMIENYDTDKDGKISIAEAESVMYIYCVNKEEENYGIKSLEGIEYCKNLNILYCYYNELTELDLSQNTKLQVLRCRNNQITSLILGDNPNLRLIDCRYNQIETIDLSKLTGLRNLYSGRNNWKSIDVSHNLELLQLGVDGSKLNGVDGLTELDLSNNTKLNWLWCSDNNIPALDLSKNTELRTLGCGGNPLNSIDLSNNLYLEEFWINYTPTISSLNVSMLSHLKQLYCYDIPSLSSLDVSGNPLLSVLICRNSNLSELNVSSNSELKILSCSGNNISSLNFTNNPNLQYIDCRNNRLEYLDLSYTKINLCENNELDWLEWPSTWDFPVFCKNNPNLTKVVIDKGWKIEGLNKNRNTDCIDAGTEIAELDYITFEDTKFETYMLKNFDANNDGRLSTIEALDVIEIQCSGTDYINNGITSLKGIEYCSNLEYLYCNSNQLTSIDISHNTNLKNLGCDNNQLTVLDVTANTALEYLSFGANKLTTINVSNCSALIGLWCWQNNLSSIDVSKNTLLEFLNFDNNQVKSVDLSNNNYLKDLSFHENLLTELNVSNLTDLDKLICANNQLTSLGVSSNKKLTALHCNGNQLTVLDVSNNTALNNLNCSYNQLTELDLSKNTVLTGLNCSYNQLTTLDVRNTKVTGLNCLGNPLTHIDLGGNNPAAFSYPDGTEISW